LRSAVGGGRNTDGALKCTATKSMATAKQYRRDAENAEKNKPGATAAGFDEAEPPLQVQRQSQKRRRPSPPLSRTAKSGCATKGGRSKQRPYQFKTKLQDREPAGRRRYGFNAIFIFCGGGGCRIGLRHIPPGDRFPRRCGLLRRLRRIRFRSSISWLR